MERLGHRDGGKLQLVGSGWDREGNRNLAVRPRPEHEGGCLIDAKRGDHRGDDRDACHPTRGLADAGVDHGPILRSHRYGPVVQLAHWPFSIRPIPTRDGKMSRWPTGWR